MTCRSTLEPHRCGLDPHDGAHRCDCGAEWEFGWLRVLCLACSDPLPPAGGTAPWRLCEGCGAAFTEELIAKTPEKVWEALRTRRRYRTWRKTIRYDPETGAWTTSSTILGRLLGL